MMWETVLATKKINEHEKRLFECTVKNSINFQTPVSFPLAVRKAISRERLRTPPVGTYVQKNPVITSPSKTEIPQGRQGT